MSMLKKLSENLKQKKLQRLRTKIDRLTDGSAKLATQRIVENASKSNDTGLKKYAIDALFKKHKIDALKGKELKLQDNFICRVAEQSDDLELKKYAVDVLKGSDLKLKNDSILGISAQSNDIDFKKYAIDALDDDHYIAYTAKQSGDIGLKKYAIDAIKNNNNKESVDHCITMVTEQHNDLDLKKYAIDAIKDSNGQIIGESIVKIVAQSDDLELKKYAIDALKDSDLEDASNFIVQIAEQSGALPLKKYAIDALKGVSAKDERAGHEILGLGQSDPLLMADALEALVERKNKLSEEQDLFSEEFLDEDVQSVLDFSKPANLLKGLEEIHDQGNQGVLKLQTAFSSAHENKIFDENDIDLGETVKIIKGITDAHNAHTRQTAVLACIKN